MGHPAGHVAEVGAELEQAGRETSTEANADPLSIAQTIGLPPTEEELLAYFRLKARILVSTYEPGDNLMEHALAFSQNSEFWQHAQSPRVADLCHRIGRMFADAVLAPRPERKLIPVTRAELLQLAAA